MESDTVRFGTREYAHLSSLVMGRLMFAVMYMRLEFCSFIVLLKRHLISRFEMLSSSRMKFLSHSRSDRTGMCL